MTDQQNPDHTKLLEELRELHHKLHHYREYDLNAGKWNPETILALLEIREQAIKKAIEAVKLGYNRQTIVETILLDLGIQPHYPTF